MQHSDEERLTLFSASEWELLVRDWGEVLKSEYHTVERIGGAGDQGRDVVCYTADPKTNPPWDNFQCKRYDRVLVPSDIWLELGKLCWFTFKGEFSIPRRYRFVSPKNVGTKLFKAMEKSEPLRAGLIENWTEHCSADITAKEKVALDGSFKNYVEGFDFSIVGYLPTRKLLEQIKGTAAYITRFGGGLPQRPPDQAPPAQLAPIEARYVRHLLDAYGDCLQCSLDDISALASPLHRRHFDRSREHFYRAESLRVFSRPTVPEGTFEALQLDIYDGVIDVCESTHLDGFERVKATTQAAREVHLTSNALITVLNPADRSGICHQLATADKLVWVKS